ncbi:sushi domain containing 2 [Seminavis robusta]|uniref:Sushi domain containing 2 n=1 Tax=Seminavis robusta TaxID=568900 RepID=A0A9N8ERY7_9STRA|nr:sushi domain containing 2 [Seminavis robusta]|eukprot:Sro1785_g297370.1 sushi domain containing 2 (1402) ;mRNA; f:383-4716
MIAMTGESGVGSNLGKACLEMDKDGSLITSFVAADGFVVLEANLWAGFDIEELLDVQGNVDKSKFSVSSSELAAEDAPTLAMKLSSGHLCDAMDSYHMAFVGELVVAELEEDTGDTVTGTEQTVHIQDGVEDDYLSLSLSVDCMCQVETPETCLKVPDGKQANEEGKVCYDVMTDTSAPDGGSVTGKACLEVNDDGDLGVTFTTSDGVELLETHLWVGEDVEDLLDESGDVDKTKFTTSTSDLGGIDHITLTTVLSSGIQCVEADSYTMALVGQVVVESDDGTQEVAYIIESPDSDHLSMSFTVECMCQPETPDTCLKVSGGKQPDEDGEICYDVLSDTSAPGGGSLVGTACVKVSDEGDIDVTFKATGLLETSLWVGEDLTDLIDDDGEVDTSKFTTTSTELGGTDEFSLSSVLSPESQCEGADEYTMTLVGQVVVSGDDGTQTVAYIHDSTSQGLDQISMTLTVDCMCKHTGEYRCEDTWAYHKTSHLCAADELGYSYGGWSNGKYGMSGCEPCDCPVCDSLPSAPSKSPTAPTDRQAPTPAYIPDKPSPVSFPPVNLPQKCVGYVGKWSGDPHMKTFDGLKYDCQGAGEFHVLKSLNSTFELQARFEKFNREWKKNRPQPTVTTSVAFDTGDGEPLIQVSVPETSENGCTPFVYVNGILKDASELAALEDDFVQVKEVHKKNTDGFIFYYLNSKVQLTTMAKKSSKNGCVLSSKICLPYDYERTTKETFVGLLGTPNKDKSDDWMTNVGTPVSIPTKKKDLRFGPAYEYCTKNWCIRNETVAMFEYPSGKKFSDYSYCDQDPDTETESCVTDPPAMLRRICGSENDACLVDGCVGTAEDAKRYIETQWDLVDKTCGEEVESEDFEGDDANSWGEIRGTGDQNKLLYLHQGNSSMLRTFNVSKDSEFVSIDFYFYEFGDWDKSGDKKDYVYLNICGTKIDIQSFNHNNDAFDDFVHDTVDGISYVREAISKSGNLGFSSTDQMHKISIHVPSDLYQDGKLTFGLEVDMTGSKRHESAGIDDLVIMEYLDNCDHVDKADKSCVEQVVKEEFGEGIDGWVPALQDMLPESQKPFLGRLYRDSGPVEKQFDVPAYADSVTMDFLLYEIDDWSVKCDSEDTDSEDDEDDKDDQTRRRLEQGKSKKTKTKNGKVVVCHRTSSRKNPYVNITVSESAVSSYLRKNGDVLPGYILPGHGGRMYLDNHCKIVVGPPKEVSVRGDKSPQVQGGCYKNKFVITIGGEKFDLGNLEGDNTRSGVAGEIRWERQARSVENHFGFNDKYKDQMHKVIITVPSKYFETDHKLTVAFDVDTTKDLDEISAGIDEFRMTAHGSNCADGRKSDAARALHAREISDRWDRALDESTECNCLCPDDSSVVGGGSLAAPLELDLFVSPDQGPPANGQPR